MIIYTPIIAGQPAQLQQAIPYGEVRHIQRANGQTFLKQKSVRGMTQISETLTAIKNQSQRNDMILVTRYTTTVGAATTQFLLPMERIKQMTVASGNRTQITFNDGDNPIVVIETLAQIQASNSATLPTGDNFINSVSYPSESELLFGYALGTAPLLVNLPVANYPNTWFVDAQSGNDNTAIRGSITKPYQNIENAILAAANYYASQGTIELRQNVIVFAGVYKISDGDNPTQNFLVRDGVDTYCHAGVFIRYNNTDPNQCTEPFFDNGKAITSSFKGSAIIERFADNSVGTRTTGNIGSQIVVELDTYTGSAMQVNEGFLFWFKCKNYINQFASSVTTLYVSTTAFCDIKFKANKVSVLQTSSYCCLISAAVDCTIDFDVDNLTIDLFGTEIQIASIFVADSVINYSNFRIGQINQQDFSSYQTLFFATNASIINASQCKCDDYNGYCGAFFEISDNSVCESFSIDITGKAIQQKLPSRIFANTRIICELDVEIIDSDTIDLVDFVVNCQNGNKDIKPKITGVIKATNAIGGHSLFGADLAVYPSFNALAALYNLHIRTDYPAITNFPSNVNVPCLNVVSNINFGANTTTILTPPIISSALSL